MKFTPSQLEEFQTRGYVVVTCPFSRDLTEQCRAAVEKVAIDADLTSTDGRRNHFRLAPQIPDSYWCALDHSLAFLQVTLHPEILELARQLVGEEDIYLRNGCINELAPERSFWWHRDTEQVWVEFMHYFSGAAVNDGCLRVIPGSHIGPCDDLTAAVERQRTEQGYPQAVPADGWADVELPGEVSLEMDPDHLLVRSSRFFHATWLNRSKCGRLMNHWIFRESASGNHRFRFEEYLAPELIESLTPSQRDALWLNRAFEIDASFKRERQRELGKVFWGVI